MKISKEDLKFAPLEHTAWIYNATVKINDRTQLSISYNRDPDHLVSGQWWVGREDDYEVAIQLHDGTGNECDLVHNSEGDTVFCHCDLEKINRIAEEAAGLVYAGHIKVFDSQDGSSDKKWVNRFHCAIGNDLIQKLNYSKIVWGRHYYRFVPATPDPLVFES